MENKDAPIYLDYNATTPVDPEVFQAMEPFFKQNFGNPASAGHHWGWVADGAVTKARQQLASLIGSKPQEILFTGGATESNNTVVFGLISKIREENPQEKIHFITSTVEHSSILKSMAAAEKMGVEVDFLPVNKYGQVEAQQVREALRPHTRLLSFIWVNNEIGTINPIPELAKLAKEKKIYLHTDATQALGKFPLNVTELGIDMMSFSGHKIYGPKGVGALYVRGKDPKVQINPLLFGGGQEKGLRSGTVNVPGVVGFGQAAELCEKWGVQDSARLKELADLMWKQLQEAIPGIRLNGHPTERASNNLNITLPHHKTEQILAQLQKLGVSTGSACGTGMMVVSHVLLGIGLSSDEVQRSLRLSLGRWSTREEVERAVIILKNAVQSEATLKESL